LINGGFGHSVFRGRPAFGAFLQHAFESKVRQSCDVTLHLEARSPLEVEQEAIAFESTSFDVESTPVKGTTITARIPSTSPARGTRWRNRRSAGRRPHDCSIRIFHLPSSQPPSDIIPITGNRLEHNSSLRALSLSALGVVFGDIGTSPLYTLKTVLALTGGKPDRAVILGTLSLVIWTLIIVTTIKYVSFAMRIDNDGEGGILALMSLLGVKLKPRPVIVALGLLGAALIYGDGAVTPAISVLSAVEGLNIVAPSFSPYVLASAVLILVALFLIQSQGTARIGRAFGPIMLTAVLSDRVAGAPGCLGPAGSVVFSRF